MIKPLEFAAVELPEFREIRGKDYVTLGAKNDFPNKLIELYEGSSIHHTCIQAKVDGTIGDGIAMVGGEYINQEGETWNDILSKVALDYMIFGTYALNVIWNRAGDRIAEVYHLPVANVRSGKMDEMDKVNEYFYSSNWGNTRKYVPVAYPAFSTTDTKGDNSSQIYYCKKYTPGATVYGLPSYMGCLNYAQLEKDISVFHANQIENGMFPGMMITLTNGSANPEERQMIYRDLERSFSGSKNAGKMFLSFVDSPDRAPQVQTIDQANDDYYVILSDAIKNAITTAHRITSNRLIGISDPSGFSNNADEIKVAYAHFYSTVIEPIQQHLEKTLGYIAKNMGFNIDFNIIPSKIDFDDTIEGSENTIQE